MVVALRLANYMTAARLMVRCDGRHRGCVCIALPPSHSAWPGTKSKGRCNPPSEAPRSLGMAADRSYCCCRIGWR